MTTSFTNPSLDTTMYNITKRFGNFLATCVLLGAACNPDLDSAGVTPEANDEAVVTPAELGLGEGWVALEEGLWTRFDDAGEQEFVGIGEAGTLHAIASLEQVEDEFVRALEVNQSEETREQLIEVRSIIADLHASPLALDTEAVTPRCTVLVSGSAFAGPIACGVSASASATYQNTCDINAIKTVATFASATCNAETKTHSCGPRTGNSASCSSSASITGPAPCNSYASAQIPGAYLWKQNYTRGTCGGPGGTGWGEPSCGGYGQPICK